jgi:hypothetical protein
MWVITNTLDQYPTSTYEMMEFFVYVFDDKHFNVHQDTIPPP